MKESTPQQEIGAQLSSIYTAHKNETAAIWKKIIVKPETAPMVITQLLTDRHINEAVNLWKDVIETPKRFNYSNADTDYACTEALLNVPTAFSPEEQATPLAAALLEIRELTNTDDGLDSFEEQAMLEKYWELGALAEERFDTLAFKKADTSESFAKRYTTHRMRALLAHQEEDGRFIYKERGEWFVNNECPQITEEELELEMPS